MNWNAISTRHSDPAPAVDTSIPAQSISESPSRVGTGSRHSSGKSASHGHGRWFSVQIRHWLPRSYRRRDRPECLAHQLRRLRYWLIALATLPITAMLLRIGLTHSNRGLPWADSSTELLAASLFMIAAGTGVALWAIPVYRKSHRRQLRNSLRYHHRGVALRSFISKWDNPSQSIYRSCRLSARLAKFHDSQFLAMIGCFAIAGCFAGLVRMDYFVGEILCGLSVIAIGSRWPTAHRLVRWCGRVIDPLCAGSAEYTEY